MHKKRRLKETKNDDNEKQTNIKSHPGVSYLALH